MGKYILFYKMPVRNSAPIGTQTIPLSFSPEVLHALRFKTPIVA